MECRECDSTTNFMLISKKGVTTFVCFECGAEREVTLSELNDYIVNG